MAWVGYIAVSIVLLASVITAIGVIWKKVIQPTAKFITLMGEVKPLLEELADFFKNNPNGLKVLDEIQSEFKSDSGSTLKDQINRLEAWTSRADAAVERAETAAQSLKVDKEVERRLAAIAQKQVDEMRLLIDRVEVITKAGAATGLRNEAAAQIVANDLTAAHVRADAVADDHSSGAAADAAAKSDN